MTVTAAGAMSARALAAPGVAAAGPGFIGTGRLGRAYDRHSAVRCGLGVNDAVVALASSDPNWICSLHDASHEHRGGRADLQASDTVAALRGRRQDERAARACGQLQLSSLAREWPTVDALN